MKIELLADYFQFYLQDDDQSLGLLADAWSKDATNRLRIAVAPGIVGVQTARNDRLVVEVEVTPTEPPLATESWAHVVEADLLCATGRIVIAGCSDYFPDARRLRVDAGAYRVRVLFGYGSPATDSIGDLMRYRVELWPTAQAGQTAVLKAGPAVWAG